MLELLCHAHSGLSMSRLGMTKRASEDSITLDNYDPQSLEVARQIGTRLFTTRIDHSVHDGYVRNSLLNDLVIDCDDVSVVNNVIRGSGEPCYCDCSTHAMISDVCPPRRVREADTIIVSYGLANYECIS